MEQWDPNCILRSFLWAVLSRCLQGPRFIFGPPLWKTDWQLVTGRARALGTHREPCRRCPEPWQRKCGQASTRWGTRCRPIMFHWNPNKAQNQDHFLETPRLETGTHPEPHNSWSPSARMYVPHSKLYLGVTDWLLSSNQTITRRPKAFCSLLRIKRPSITDHASRLVTGVGTLGRLRFPVIYAAHGNPEAGAWHWQLRSVNAPLLLGD